MPSGDNWIAALASGSLGAALGGVITGIIQALSHKAESRATAADLVTKAAGSMVERYDKENKQLRQAVLLLTDVLDEVLPLIEAPPEAMSKLRAAKRAAELAV
jgi:hypothetical protein